METTGTLYLNICRVSCELIFSHFIENTKNDEHVKAKIQATNQIEKSNQTPEKMT